MNEWATFLGSELQQPYMQKTLEYVANRRSEGIAVYPGESQVFNAFEATALKDIRVVILGQDPYHGEGQAHGLCFSVQPEVKKLPPSLKKYVQRVG